MSNTKNIGILFTASLAAVLPMIIFGIFEGIDLPQHLQFATTYYQSILTGDFYPSWAATENLGYGSLGVRFYPPLSAYTIALLRFLTGDWYSSVWTTFLIFSFGGGFGVYLWAKEYFDSTKAVWAGILFIFSPFHLFEILNLSLYAEFAGASVLPFCFLFVNRVCRRGKIEDVIGLTISYAVLILTHLPLTVIGSLSLLVYALIYLSKTKNWTAFLKLATAVIFGLMASSFYWLRVITEKQWLRITNLTPDKAYFDYNLHFLLIPPRTEVDLLWFLNLIVITLLLTVIAAKINLLSNGLTKLNQHLRSVYTLFFFSIFMLTPLSKPIWAFLPFLNEVQFPWRWLVIPSLSGSILIASNLNVWSFSQQSSVVWEKARRLTVFASILLIVLIYGSIYYKFYYSALDQKTFNTWVDDKSKSLGFEWFWTIKTKKEAFSIPEKVVADERRFEILEWQPTERHFTVEQGNKTFARVATLFYPNWKAMVNDSPVEIEPDENGAILIPLPEQNSDVKLYFQESPIVQIGQWLSVFVWAVVIIIGLLNYLKFSLLIFKNRSKVG